MATTKQQKMIDSMFCRVDKEKKVLIVAHKVQALSKDIQSQIQENKTTPPPFKRPIGRPQKPMQTTLISEREIKKETIDDATNSKPTKKTKKGVYTNWFAPHLWLSILATLKKHGDLPGAFHHLKTFHKKSGKVSGPYEKLNRRYFYEWFTPIGELKLHVKVVVEKMIASTTVEKNIFQFLKQDQN